MQNQMLILTFYNFGQIYANLKKPILNIQVLNLIKILKSKISYQ